MTHFSFQTFLMREDLVCFIVWKFLELIKKCLKLWTPPALTGSGWMNRLLLRPLVLREEDHNQTTWTSLLVSFILNAPKALEIILSLKAIQIFNKKPENYVKITQKQRGRI